MMKRPSTRPGPPRPAGPAVDDLNDRRIGPSHTLNRPNYAGYVTQSGTEDEPLGAAWYRLFAADRHGYGFIDAARPELAMAVVERHRGAGIGSALLRHTLRVDEGTDIEPSVSASLTKTDRRWPSLRGSDSGESTLLAMVVSLLED